MLHGVDFVSLSPFAVLLSVFLHPLWVRLHNRPLAFDFIIIGRRALGGD
jgi:hypothetical protein